MVPSKSEKFQFIHLSPRSVSSSIHKASPQSTVLLCHFPWTIGLNRRISHPIRRHRSRHYGIVYPNRYSFRLVQSDPLLPTLMEGHVMSNINYTSILYSAGAVYDINYSSVYNIPLTINCTFKLNSLTHF